MDDDGLKRVKCDSACGFTVQSKDKNELIEMYILHVEKAHNMKIMTDDVEEKISSSLRNFQI